MAEREREEGHSQAMLPAHKISEFVLGLVAETERERRVIVKRCYRPRVGPHNQRVCLGVSESQVKVSAKKHPLRRAQKPTVIITKTHVISLCDGEKREEEKEEATKS